MPSITREQPPRGSPTRSAIRQPISAPDGLPVTCSLTLVYRASLLVAPLVALASAVGLTFGRSLDRVI